MPAQFAKHKAILAMEVQLFTETYLILPSPAKIQTSSMATMVVGALPPQHGLQELPTITGHIPLIVPHMGIDCF